MRLERTCPPNREVNNQGKLFTQPLCKGIRGPERPTDSEGAGCRERGAWPLLILLQSQNPRRLNILGQKRVHSLLRNGAQQQSGPSTGIPKPSTKGVSVITQTPSDSHGDSRPLWSLIPACLPPNHPASQKKHKYPSETKITHR